MGVTLGHGKSAPTTGYVAIRGGGYSDGQFSPSGQYRRDFVNRQLTRRPHYGLDIVAPPGAPVFAAAAGEVDTISTAPNLGHFVQIRHSDGMHTIYAHLIEEPNLVKENDWVASGDVIGQVGDSGNAKGTPHLHFEIKNYGSTRQPEIGKYGEGNLERLSPLIWLQRDSVN